MEKSALYFIIIKLRLDVVSGDSSGPLPMFANMLILKSLTIQFNISGKISAQRFEISPQWFSKCQPEKFLSFIMGYYENVITSNLLNMHL